MIVRKRRCIEKREVNEGQEEEEEERKLERDIDRIMKGFQEEERVGLFPHPPSSSFCNPPISLTNPFYLNSTFHSFPFPFLPNLFRNRFNSITNSTTSRSQRFPRSINIRRHIPLLPLLFLQSLLLGHIFRLFPFLIDSHLHVFERFGETRFGDVVGISWLRFWWGSRDREEGTD